MKSITIILFLLSFFGAQWGYLIFPNENQNSQFLTSETQIALLLKSLTNNDTIPFLPDTTFKGVSSIVGEDIVLYGSSNRDGLRKAKRQSRFFVCTSCHNIEKEDPNLAINDPQARLIYTNEQEMPYLQATTFYGAVNRESFYNGDYEKKYGELVAPARNSIRGAIQLCATECAQGRALEPWEIESILSFLWKKQLKLQDLNLNTNEWNLIEKAIETGENRIAALGVLKTKYLRKSEATFLTPPINRQIGTNLKGNPENGKLIYENSCLHCHYRKQYSFFNLDTSGMSFKYLANKSTTYDRHSIYQVVRYGTYSKSGKKSYMPNYTKQKMSNQQLADLRAYIDEKAQS